MAIIKTLPASLSMMGIDIPNMYWRVSKINIIRSDDAQDDELVKRLIAHIIVKIYPQRPVLGTKVVAADTIEVPLEELEAAVGEDLFAKAYEYLKTQDEFSDSVDV